MDYQRKVSKKLGEILKYLGYATEEDIKWALEKMDRKDSSSFSQTLRTHCDAIAERWYREIAATSCVPLKGPEVCQHLMELSIKVIRLLLAEPFEPEKAQEIGANLARLHYLQPEALGGTLQVLASHLVEGLPPDSVAALQPRLAEMLGRLATGFFYQARQTILEEQEQIRSALFTEQERAEKGLRIKESAIASSINAIVMADMRGNLTYANRSFLDMWGYDDEEEVQGRPAVEFWQRGDEANEVINAVRNRRNWTGELVGKRKDGSLFDVHLSASAVTDNYGRAICMMGSFVDITEQKQMEKSLRESKAELEERTKRLEEVNTTLKVLLERRKEGKKALEEKVQFNVKELVVLLVEKLKK